MARHDPARWICQCKSTLCDGVFYAYGREYPCPLWSKCKGHKHQIEYLYPQQHQNQRKIVLAEPDRYAAHAKRACDLRRAFLTGEDNPDKRYYDSHKDVISAKARRKYREENPVESRVTTRLKPPPPCGEDCMNCPYEDGCHYADWGDDGDGDIYITKGGEKRNRKTERAYNRLYREIVMEKRTEDQDLDEWHKARNRRYAAKGRAKKRFIKAGGSVAMFNILWARAGADPEAFNELWKGENKPWSRR